jgi:hypothetical protein
MFYTRSYIIMYPGYGYHHCYSCGSRHQAGGAQRGSNQNVEQDTIVLKVVNAEVTVAFDTSVRDADVWAKLANPSSAEFEVWTTEFAAHLAAKWRAGGYILDPSQVGIKAFELMMTPGTPLDGGRRLQTAAARRLQSGDTCGDAGPCAYTLEATVEFDIIIDDPEAVDMPSIGASIAANLQLGCDADAAANDPGRQSASGTASSQPLWFVQSCRTFSTSTVTLSSEIGAEIPPGPADGDSEDDDTIWGWLLFLTLVCCCCGSIAAGIRYFQKKTAARKDKRAMPREADIVTVTALPMAVAVAAVGGVASPVPAQVLQLQVDQAFKQADLDRNGTINRGEIMAYVRGLNLPGVTADYVEGVWLVHDLNGDGVLQKPEFAGLLAVLHAHAAQMSQRIDARVDEAFEKAGQGGAGALTATEVLAYIRDLKLPGITQRYVEGVRRPNFLTNQPTHQPTHQPTRGAGVGGLRPQRRRGPAALRVRQPAGGALLAPGARGRGRGWPAGGGSGAGRRGVIDGLEPGLCQRWRGDGCRDGRAVDERRHWSGRVGGVLVRGAPAAVLVTPHDGGADVGATHHISAGPGRHLRSGDAGGRRERACERAPKE